MLSPDILWIALWRGQTGHLMARHCERVNAGFMHGVGAAFDFQRNKPGSLWMRNAGLGMVLRCDRPRRLFNDTRCEPEVRVLLALFADRTSESC